MIAPKVPSRVFWDAVITDALAENGQARTGRTRPCQKLLPPKKKRKEKASKVCGEVEGCGSGYQKIYSLQNYVRSIHYHAWDCTLYNGKSFNSEDASEMHKRRSMRNSEPSIAMHIKGPLVTETSHRHAVESWAAH